MWKSVLVVLFPVLLLLSCDLNTRADDYDHLQDRGYSLVKVAYNQLYQNRPALYNTMNANPMDEAGVSLFAWEGEFYYHPVLIGQRCQQALSDYNNTTDQRYLDYVRASVSALSERAARFEDKILFSYMFDFSPGHTTLTYHAPWYSGMAQGVLLSVTSRMYHLTGEARYKELADSTFASLADLDSDKACVYVSQADSLGVPDDYYWVDEYPGPVQRYVLNGSMIGSIGLYDYWWVFGNTLAGRLFSMQLSAVRDNVLLYRNPGAPSSYCLKFKYQDPNYHALHQVLLNQYFLYSGDPYFQAVSNLLSADYH
jgi:hypothetical protein